MYFGVLLYWILFALVWFTPLAVPAYLATVAALSALCAGFAWLLHAALRDARAPLWLALPVAWTALEWVRAHLPDALAFPWLGLGTSLTGFPRLVGIAELVGARGVGFWIALVNGLVATLLLAGTAHRPSGRLWPALALALAFVAPPAWGIRRAASLPLREAARVAVVQPDVPEHLKLDAASAEDSTRASLATLLKDVAPGSVDLVVLPEVVFPGLYPEAPQPGPALGFLTERARELGVPILFGGLGASVGGSGRAVPFNSAFLVGPDGLAPFRYDKRALVPGVERIPFLPRRWEGATARWGGYGVGRGWPLAHVGGVAYGVLICYESSYPQLGRRLRLEGADVLVNLTNDAWYGRDPWYARTTALWQHPAHLVMRAIEGRVGIVRAANTGISLFVDPVGRVHDDTDLFRAEARSATVLTTDVSTLFSRTGDVVGTASALGALALLLVAWSARRTAAAATGGRRDLDPTPNGH